MNYSIGDLVTWESQSGGTTKSKTGTIVSICKAGEQPIAHVQNFAINRESTFWRSRPQLSKNDRYVVEVPRDSRTYKVWFYTPSIAMVDGTPQSKMGVL